MRSSARYPASPRLRPDRRPGPSIIGVTAAPAPRRGRRNARVVSARQPHRPPHVELLGRDPDLGAEPELLAVGESGGGVDHHHRAVGAVDKGVGRRDVLGDDRFGVPGAVGEDMLDSRIEVGHHPHRHHQIEILGVPVLVAWPGPISGTISLAAGVAAQLDPGVMSAPWPLVGRNSAATDWWTRSFSAALHTPGRCVLALTTTDTAWSRSAAAST